jgi:hypothetical protein
MMQEKLTIVPGIKVKWKGIFSMDGLYKNIKFWLDYQGYGNQDKTFQEEKYVERIKGESKQLEIRWVARKDVSDYFSFVIQIAFFVLGLKDVEIEKDGKKIKTQAGEIEIRIKSHILTDRSKKWGESKGMFQSIYEKFIIADRIDDYKINLYSKTYAMQDEIKSYLTMRQY